MGKRGLSMPFEWDRIVSGPEGERYNVYVTANRKKRCIGQVVLHAKTGQWTAYAEGDVLTVALTKQEAAEKLWLYREARRPSTAESGVRKPVWECSLEERFERLRRKIPRQSHFTGHTVLGARQVPMERRARLENDIAELIDDLEIQLHWWRKVKKELAAAPKLELYR
jgi:hypothetical protein